MRCWKVHLRADFSPVRSTLKNKIRRKILDEHAENTLPIATIPIKADIDELSKVYLKNKLSILIKSCF